MKIEEFDNESYIKWHDFYFPIIEKEFASMPAHLLYSGKQKTYEESERMSWLKKIAEVKREMSQEEFRLHYENRPDPK